MSEEGLKATKIQVQVLEEILSYKDKEIERLNNIIKEVREILNQEWYSVLRKEAIRKAREILDKE